MPPNPLNVGIGPTCTPLWRSDDSNWPAQKPLLPYTLNGGKLLIFLTVTHLFRSVRALTWPQILMTAPHCVAVPLHCSKNRLVRGFTAIDILTSNQDDPQGDWYGDLTYVLMEGNCMMKHIRESYLLCGELKGAYLMFH